MQGTTGNQTRRAVVIEDDPEIRALYRPVLERLGFETIMTTNGTDGVAAIAEFSPVITFLDVSMGGMDGFTTAARIREFSDTYVVMISAHADEIDVVQGLAAGADDYIFKPFRPRELRARVEAMLRRPRHFTLTSHSGNSSQGQAEPAPVVEPDLWQAGDANHGPLRSVAAEQLASPAPVSVAAPVSAPVASRATTTVPQLRRTTLKNQHDAVVAGANAMALVADSEQETEPAPALATATQPRPNALPNASARPNAGALTHGALSLDLATARVSLGDQHIELDAAEVNLLASLMETGTRVRSTANLVLALRGESYVTTYFVNETDKRTVVETLDTLRRRLGDTGPVPIWVEPVGTIGFRMTPA